MTRTEVVERIARGELSWGLQRGMFIRDRRGRELPKTEALQVLRAWANGLPEATFREYAERHAPAFHATD